MIILDFMRLKLMLEQIKISVPTQKMPRKLATSASACRKLSKKSEVMGINTKALEFEETQVSYSYNNYKFVEHLLNSKYIFIYNYLDCATA